MYGYEELNEITPEQVLQKVSQEDIFKLVFKCPIEEGVNKYKSPFRDDKKAGCRFERREDGALIFIDFGESRGRTHRNCFGAIMDYETVNLDTAIKIVCKHFNIPNDSAEYLDTKIGYNKQHKDEDNVSTQETIITYNKIPYEKANKFFWLQFLIQEEHLLEDYVFNSDGFTIDSRKGKRTIKVFGHCYVIDFLDAVKIYQPYSLTHKWITNCYEDHIGNIDNLPATGDRLVIAKSYKDHRVVRNLGVEENVIWFHNEGTIPSFYILRNLVSRFKEIVVFYDNDEKGMIEAMKLVNLLNEIRKGCARIVYMPVGGRDKDIGEYVVKEGREDSIKILKTIGL